MPASLLSIQNVVARTVYLQTSPDSTEFNSTGVGHCRHSASWVELLGRTMWSLSELSSTGQKSRQFAVSREILNVLRISRLTENWRLFGRVELSFESDHITRFSSSFLKIRNSAACSFFFIVFVHAMHHCLWSGPRLAFYCIVTVVVVVRKTKKCLKTFVWVTSRCWLSVWRQRLVMIDTLNGSYLHQQRYS